MTKPPSPFWLAISVFLIGMTGLPAQELNSPPNPLDLARGLRENGLPDLAMEYLEQLSTTSNLPAEITSVLPIERAKARLDYANQETDEGKRDSAITMAKGEFDAFIKANPTHPRLPEARVSLARVTFLQGRTYLSRAFRLTQVDARKVELARARPFFKDAAKSYEEAAAALEKLSQSSDLSPTRKRELIRETQQARLDQAVCGFNLAETYYKPRDTKEVDLRYGAYKDARTLFIRLGNEDLNSPVSWVAKAWAIECSNVMPDTNVAEKATVDLKAAIRQRGPLDPAAMAGNRQLLFFELRRKWETIAEGSQITDFQAARKLCTDWLTQFRSQKWSPEHYATTYYLGTLRVDEAKTRATGKDGKPISPTPKDALDLLREAEKDFRKLTESDNEYAIRAARERSEAIRLLVGDTVKPVNQYTTFEELHMAALVLVQKANTAKEKEARQAFLSQVIPILERERTMPISRENQREAQNGQLMLIRIYMEMGRPFQAAIMAEHMAKTSRSSSLIASAGYNALLAYLTAASLAQPTDLASKKADQERAVAMATFLEKTVPDDPVTDAARFQLAILLFNEGRTVELYDVLHRISPRFSLLANARLMQGGAAYEMVRFRRPEEPSLIPDEKKPLIFRQALADLNAVLPPPTAAPAESAAIYIRLQMQIAQLHLTNKQDGYPQAEKTATDAKTSILSYPSLQAEDKKALALDLSLRCELLRIDAVFGQARLEMDAGKFKEAAERLGGLLAETAKDKSLLAMVNANEAFKSDQQLVALAKRVDDSRLERIVGLALNCRVREGDLPKAGELLKLLDDLGGDITRSTAAVYRLVNTIRPQIESLKKDNMPEEAAKLSAGVADLVAQFAAKENLTPDMQYNLGRAFKELGEFKKAAELLAKIARPEDPAFVSGVAPPGEDDEMRATRLKADALKRDQATLYRGAQLELIRALRQSGDFAKAEELLEAALGKDPEKPLPMGQFNKNWGYRFVDFRKERFLTLEAKAAATEDVKAASALWVEAKQGWEKLAVEYQSSITRWTPKPPTSVQMAQQAAGGILAFVGPQKEDYAKVVATVLKPRFYDTFFEAQRCRTRALVQVTKGRAAADIERSMAGVALTLVNVEKTTPDMANDIVDKYRALLNEFPVLKSEYQKAGGVKFTAMTP